MTSGDNPKDEDSARSDELVTLFKRGLKFTEELMAENEKLRFRVASLEATADAQERHGGTPVGDALVDALKRQVEELQAERLRLMDSYQQVEETNRTYQARYIEIEEEYNRLANLYIASFQLHSTVAFREVVQVVCEIVINLFGVSRFTLYLHDAPGEKLVPIATEGHPLADAKEVAKGEGTVGQAFDASTKVVSMSDDNQSAVVTLRTAEALVGALSVEALLVQKDTFTDVDTELFQLLGGQAAGAMLAGLIQGLHEEEPADVLRADLARQLLEVGGAHG